MFPLFGALEISLEVLCPQLGSSVQTDMMYRRVQWKDTKISWQECMTSAEKQKTLKKRRQKGGLSALFNYYKGGYIEKEEREDEATLFLKVCNGRTEDSGNKWKHGKFH